MSGLAAAVKGAKRPSQIITWVDIDGNAVDLTDATIAARIRSLQTGQVRDADGVFVVTDAAQGVFRWDYGDSDVSEAGIFQVQFTASYASGLTPARTIVARWVVHGALWP